MIMISTKNIYQILRLCLLIVLLGILYSTPVIAQICQCGFADGQFTLIEATMDGNMDDWDPVLSDTDNSVCDGTGEGADRDFPIQSTGRDLRQFAFTWDDTYLSAFTRRYASTSNRNNFIYYADTNTDGLMSDGEPVIVIFWSGSNRNVELFIGSYDAIDPNGDPLVDQDGFADGYAMPGSLVGNFQGKGQYGGRWGADSGTEMEWQVRWSDLGVPAGTAISWHVSTTNVQPGSNNLASQIDDNLGGCGGGIGGTQYADISFTQSTSDTLPAGSTVYLPHEITNNGNIPDTFDFELTSGGDFTVSSVEYYQDLGIVGTYESGTDILLTDTDGDGFPDTGSMDIGESKSILIKAVLPSPPAAGTAILTTVATSNFIPASDPTIRITDTVQDTLTILSLLSSVEGNVFADTNHNGVKETGENGIEAVTLVLHNTTEGTCQSVQTDANGDYTFTGVASGDYQIIESATEAIPNPGSCPPAEEDPAGFISTTSNTLTITVTGVPITGQNFGNFEGAKVEGTVFNDNGIGSGTANDAIQNGGETGIANVGIQALETDGTLIRQTNTDADGGFTLFIPRSAAPDGSTIRISEINTAGFLSTGGNAGNTSGGYDISTDDVTFIITSGTNYSGILFADVGQSRLLTDGQQTLAPGTSTLFSHTFEAKTAGDVVFSTQTINNPSNATFPVVLYQDINCDGTVNSGEPILDGTTPITVTANQSVCLLVKITVPQGAGAGSSSNTTLTGSFSLSGTNPVIVQTLTRTDLVSVSVDGAGLVIVKSVDKPQALPGAELTYTISYQNSGSEPLNSLEIIDDTPSYTEFTSASCDLPLPDSLTNCSITSPGAGNTGVVTWSFPGSLAPGQSGTVTYTVTITQ